MTIERFAAIPFPRYPINNVTPFTYRDGYTYLEVLEELRRFIGEIVDVSNSNVEKITEQFNDWETWVTERDTIINDTINTAITHLTNLSESAQQAAQDVADIFAELQLNGPVLSVNGSTGIVDLPAVMRNEQVVNVRDHGATGDGATDDTAAFEAATLYASTNGIGKVIVPAGTYMIRAHDPDYAGNTYLRGTGGFGVHSNTHLELDAGATLQAITNDERQYNVIRVIDAENVVITGGKILGDRNTHTGIEGEWGYGIFVLTSSNVEIRNIEVTQCWGDGINLQQPGSPTYAGPDNVRLINVNSHHNRRQGLSIEGGTNILVSGGSYSNNGGVTPGAGIDIEPWSTAAYVDRVVIENAEFIGNEGAGLLANNAINLSNLTVDNCVFDGNQGEPSYAAQLRFYAHGTSNTVRNCVFKNTPDTMYSIYWRGGIDNLIENNVIDGATTYARLGTDYDHSGRIVRNRVVLPAGRVIVGSGLLSIGATEEVEIDSNVVGQLGASNTSHGIYLASGEIGAAHVSGNHVWGVRSAVGTTTIGPRMLSIVGNRFDWTFEQSIRCRAGSAIITGNRCNLPLLGYSGAWSECIRVEAANNVLVTGNMFSKDAPPTLPESLVGEVSEASFGVLSVSTATNVTVTGNAAFNGFREYYNGAVAPWAQLTAYAVNDTVSLVGGQVLRCDQAGTSLSIEPVPPANVGGAVVDGDILWTRTR